MTTIAKTNTPFHKIEQSQERNNHLLNVAITYMDLRNDAALARALRVAPPVISKIRNNRLPVGSTFLIELHEASGIAITSLKWLLETDIRPNEQFELVVG